MQSKFRHMMSHFGGHRRGYGMSLKTGIRPSVKNDPRLVAAARERKDRWLEQVNGGLYLPTGRAKHETSRGIGQRELERSRLLIEEMPIAASACLAACKQFENLIRTHAGDRTTCNSMVSAATGVDDEWLAADLQHRRSSRCRAGSMRSCSVPVLRRCRHRKCRDTPRCLELCPRKSD